MDQRSRAMLASVGIVGIFLVVQFGALALVEPFQQEGHQMVEDTSNPSISLLFILAILVMTGLMLAAIRYGGTIAIKGMVLFAGVYISFFVFEAIAPTVLIVSVAGGTVDVLALAGALVLGTALYLYPEWYVIDAAGIVMGIGAAGMFGINFGILPAILLLVILAVYDAISVYRTKHMLTLASGVMELRVPVVFVVPTTPSYSFLDERPAEDGSKETTGVSGRSDERSDVAPGSEQSTGRVAKHKEEPTAQDDSDQTPESGDTTLTADRLESMDQSEIAALDRAQLGAIDTEVLEAVDETTRETIEAEMQSREALFIGLGDAVIPTVLVASAAFFIETGPVVSLASIEVTVPALTAMIGTVVGLVALLSMVLKGKAHAGLPLLNGGTILGYLFGALLVGMSLVEAVGLDTLA